MPTTNGFRFVMTPYKTNGTGFFVTLLDTNPVNTAYEIYQTLNLGVIPSQTAWTLAATGAVGVTNFTLTYSTNTTNASFLAARRANSDADGFTDAYESLVLFGDADGDGLSDSYELAHGTNPNLFDSDTNGMGDNLFTLTFWINENTVFFGDDLIRGDGFRVKWSSGITFFIDQRYQDVPVRDWRDDEAHIYFPELSWDSGPDNQWHKWKVEYDYRRARITRYAGNGTTVLNSLTEWVNNITERLGTNAATTVFTNSLATMSNVVVQHFISPRKNHYVWEGVIGNTSGKQDGDSMHSTFWPVKKMVLGGSNLFYTGEYNEGGYQLQMFKPEAPQSVATNFSWKTDLPGLDLGMMFTNIAFQTNAIFAAGNTFQRMFVLSNSTADTLRTVEYPTNVPSTLPHRLTQASGTNQVPFCTLRTTGTLPQNLSTSQVYFIRVSNDTTLTFHTNAMGALFNSNRANIGTSAGSGTNFMDIRGFVYTFSAIGFAPIGTNNWYFPAEFTGNSLSPAIVASNRLAISTNPVDGKIAVFDGSSQQVKIYNANGTGVVFTIGVSNGYSNGPAVPYPKTGDTNFANVVKLGGYIDDKKPGGGELLFRTARATVCYQADGKLWVSDTATARLLCFNSDGSLDTFIETVPHSYYTSVDRNDTKRVFANFLEFRGSFAACEFLMGAHELLGTRPDHNQRNEDRLPSLLSLRTENGYDSFHRRQQSHFCPRLARAGLR